MSPEKSANELSQYFFSLKDVLHDWMSSDTCTKYRVLSFIFIQFNLQLIVFTSIHMFLGNRE